MMLNYVCTSVCMYVCTRVQWNCFPVPVIYLSYRMMSAIGLNCCEVLHCLWYDILNVDTLLHMLCTMYVVGQGAICWIAVMQM